MIKYLRQDGSLDSYHRIGIIQDLVFMIVIGIVAWLSL